MPIDLAKFKKKPQFEPKGFDLQEEKKPKIKLPKIPPTRQQKIVLKDEIEITSDNMRTAFGLVFGVYPRNTIERVFYDFARFFNDYKIEKRGRNVFCIKK